MSPSTTQKPNKLVGAVTGLEEGARFLASLGDLVETMTSEILREPDPQTLALWQQELGPIALRRLNRPVGLVADSSSHPEPSR